MNWWNAWQPLADEGWLWEKMICLFWRGRFGWIGINHSQCQETASWLGQGRGEKNDTHRSLNLLTPLNTVNPFPTKVTALGENSLHWPCYSKVPLHQGPKRSLIFSRINLRSVTQEIWARPRPKAGGWIWEWRLREGEGTQLRHYISVAWLLLSKTFWVSWDWPGSGDRTPHSWQINVEGILVGA